MDRRDRSGQTRGEYAVRLTPEEFGDFECRPCGDLSLVLDGVERTPAIFINNHRLPDTSLNRKSLQEAIDSAVNQKTR
jgi:hypothetical protein